LKITIYLIYFSSHFVLPLFLNGTDLFELLLERLLIQELVWVNYYMNLALIPRIERLPLGQKLWSLVRVLRFKIIIQVTRFHCNLTHLASVREQLMSPATIFFFNNCSLGIELVIWFWHVDVTQDKFWNFKVIEIMWWRIKERESDSVVILGIE